MTGFGVHTGVVRQHANDVKVIQSEFQTGVNGILSEAIATDVAFGILWAPTVVPSLTAVETTTGLLCKKVGDGLHDLGIRIDATADVYDKGEATNAALVARAKPDLFGTGDVLTNDTPINLGKDLATGQQPKDTDLVEGDAGIINDAIQTGVTIGKIVTGQDVDPIDLVKLIGNDLFDTIGFVLNPLGSLFGAYVGVIIDAIPPLKELLDITLGDPDAIVKVSKSWDTLARWFVDCGDRYQESLKTVTDAIWSGEAADQYRQMAANTISLLGTIGQGCELISAVVLAVGSVISTTRGKLIGLVVGFVLDQAIALALAAGLAGPTFGGSVAAFWEEFGVDAEVKATLAALSIEQAIFNLLATLEKSGEQELTFQQYEAKLSS
jgi:hypothetical protein